MGVIVGFAVSAIQAGANGAKVGEAFKAGAIGAGLGAATAVVGLGVVQFALTPVIQATWGLTQVAAQEAATNVLIGAGLGQSIYGVSQNDFSGVLGFALSTGLTLMLTNGATPARGTGSIDYGLKDPTYPAANSDGWAAVQGKFDYANIPPTSRGEYMTELFLNGRAQWEMDVIRYGSSELVGGLSGFHGASGSVTSHSNVYVDPLSGLPAPKNAGTYFGLVGPPKIDLYPRAYGSIENLEQTLTHELGHFIGYDDPGPGVSFAQSAYGFARNQLAIIDSNRARLLSNR